MPPLLGFLSPLLKPLSCLIKGPGRVVGTVKEVLTELEAAGGEDEGVCVTIDGFRETSQSTMSEWSSTSAGGEGRRGGMEHQSHLISKLLESEWARKTKGVMR